MSSLRDHVVQLQPTMRTVLAVLSGLLIWPLAQLDESFDLELSGPVGYTVIGGIFGLLVLVPFIAANARWYGRTVALVLGSIVIYALVVRLAVDGYGPLDLDGNVAIMVSGVAGALLVGALTKVLAPLRTPGKFWLYLAMAGALGGFLFNLSFDHDGPLVISAGYIGWQMPVFAALYWGSK